jgi:hypothetical protein
MPVDRGRLINVHITGYYLEKGTKNERWVPYVLQTYMIMTK